MFRYFEVLTYFEHYSRISGANRVFGILFGLKTLPGYIDWPILRVLYEYLVCFRYL